MIERYTTPEMAALWSEQSKFESWLAVELYACEAWARAGVVPAAAVESIRGRARIDVGRIEAIEKETRHDVVAFTTQIAECVGDASKWFHYGLTSSDVVDTALSIRLKRALQLIQAELKKLLAATRKLALKHKRSVCIGRTHGVHAEPTTFGLKCVLWHEQFKRDRARLRGAQRTIAVGKISGAVGTYSQITPAIEADICKRAGLRPAPVSTQILQRDRHAEVMTALAILAADIEKTALEIRHLQRTEVLEAEEGFAQGQKGSSAMPHKRNPVACENLCGLARVVRANALAALENVALWHERDISHSSAERVILADSTTLAHYMLRRLTGVLQNLQVYPERMAANLELTRGLFYSQHVLLALIEKGLLREQAYAIVQRCAMRTWSSRRSFAQNLLADREGKKWLTAKALNKIMRLDNYFRHVAEIYARCGIE